MLMPETIEPSMLAPCGMNCTVCYVHLRKKKPCAGCLSDSAGKPGHCRECPKKTCAAGRGLTFCFECTQFPCGDLKRLDRSYVSRYGVSLVANGRAAKEAGPAAFLELDRKKWTCSCGGVISLHDGFCSECGKTPGK